MAELYLDEELQRVLCPSRIEKFEAIVQGHVLDMDQEE